jgi:hypothetical protein
MVADIVTVLIQDVPNVEIVGGAERIGDCLDAGSPPVDLVICSVPDTELAPAWTSARTRRALPAVLNLCPDSVRGDLYAVYPVQHKLEDITARSLLNAVDDHIRSANPDDLRSR